MRLLRALALAAIFTFALPPAAHLIAVGSNLVTVEAHAAKRKHARARRGSDATALVIALARKHGVPQAFALKVGRQETGNRCGLWGDGGRSGGTHQIFYPTARAFGWTRSLKAFRSLSCEALSDMGMRHLAMAYRAARGNLWLAAGKHNGGLGFKGKNRMASRYATAVTGGGKKARKHRKHRRG